MQARTATLLLVAAALVTAPMVGLGTVQAGDGGATAASDDSDTPHAHDRWIDPTTGEAVTEIVLFDRFVEIEPYDEDRFFLVDSCDQSRGGPTENRICLGDAEVRPGRWANGDDKVVPPGTERVEVTLAFDGEDLHGVDAYLRHADSRGIWTRLTNATNGGPFAPGGDTRTVEPVTLGMSDDGHAQVSHWRFLLTPFGDPVTGTSTGTLDAGSGDVHVRIVAHRADGDLPLEPAHPLFWEDDDPPTDTYRIGTLEGSTDGFAQAGPATWEPDAGGTPKLGGQGLVWQVPVGFEGRRDADRHRYPDKLDGAFDAALVPPGARLLAAVVHVSDASATGDAELCVLGQDTPGAGLPAGADREDHVIDGCQPLRDGTYTFLRPIVERDTDSFYTETDSGISHSRWTFYVQIVPGEAPAGQTGAAAFQAQVDAQVFVTDQTTFEVPGWA